MPFRTRRRVTTRWPGRSSIGSPPRSDVGAFEATSRTLRDRVRVVQRGSYPLAAALPYLALFDAREMLAELELEYAGLLADSTTSEAEMAVCNESDITSDKRAHCHKRSGNAGTEPANTATDEMEEVVR